MVNDSSRVKLEAFQQEHYADASDWLQLSLEEPTNSSESFRGVCLFVLLYDILMIDVQNCRSCTPPWSLLDFLGAGIGPWTHCGQTSRSGGSTIAEGWAKGTSVKEWETATKSIICSSLPPAAERRIGWNYIVSKPPRQNKYKVAVGRIPLWTI